MKSLLLDNFEEKIGEKDKVILYVCTGGTCRSPMANVITRHYLQKGKVNIKPVSAALSGSSGKFVSDEAKDVVKNLKCSLERHKSLKCNFKLLSRADLILALTSDIRDKISDKYPDFNYKLYLFTEFFGKNGDIVDPYGGGYEKYQKCFDEINRLICGNIDKIIEK